MGFRQVFKRDTRTKTTLVAIDTSGGTLPQGLYDPCEICGSTSYFTSLYTVRIDGKESLKACCPRCVSEYGVS